MQKVVLLDHEHNQIHPAKIVMNLCQFHIHLVRVLVFLNPPADKILMYEGTKS